MHYWKVKVLGYLTGVMQFRWYALATAWLICILGWGVVAALPDSYTAEAKVYIDTDNIMDPLLKGLTVTVDPAQEIAIMLKTLITRPTLEQVIHLTDPSSNGLNAAGMQERVDELQDKISIRQLETKNYYAIGFTDRRADYATTVTQTLLSILQDNKVGSTRLDMDSVRGFINKQIADYEGRLRDADKRRADFKTAHIDVIGKGAASNRIEEASQAVDQARNDLNVAVARRDSVQAQLASTPKTVSVDERTLPGGGDNVPVQAIGGSTTQTFGNPVQRLQQARAQLDELLTRYTDNHPDVIATRDLIKRLQAQIDAEAKAPAPEHSVMVANPALAALQDKLSTEQTNVAQQQQRVAAAEQDLQKARREAGNAIDIMAEYNGLDRDYGNIEKTYQSLLQSREQAALSQARDDQNQGISFRVLEPPQRPQFPTAPTRWILNSAVLILGLAGGVGLAVVITLIAGRFLTSDEVTEYFGLPLLGVVSTVQQSGNRSSFGFSAAALSAALTLLLLSYAGVMTLLNHSIGSVLGL